MVEAGRDVEHVTVSLIAMDESFVLDRATLEVRSSSRSGLLFDAARPSTIPGRVFTVLRTSQQVAVADVLGGAGNQFDLPAPVPVGGFLTGTSPDGRWFAVAGASDLMVCDAEGDCHSTIVSGPIAPVAVHVDTAGVATVLDDQGVLHTTAGDVIGEPLADRTVTAAAHVQDDRFVAVMSDGELLILGPGREPTNFGEVPEGRRPYAIEVSPDQSAFALIGDETDIVDAGDGRVLAILSPSTELAPSSVTDVAFDDDVHGGVLVRENGDVERFDIPTVDEAVSYVTTRQPRPVNSDDRAAITGAAEEQRSP
jgi:hypothetical protein